MFAALAGRVDGRYGDLEQLEQALVDLSSPGALEHGAIDMQRAMELLSAYQDPDGALARALAGLFVLAALEGLARRYGPPTEYPGLALTSIELVGLPLPAGCRRPAPPPRPPRSPASCAST